MTDSNQTYDPNRSLAGLKFDARSVLKVTFVDTDLDGKGWVCCANCGNPLRAEGVGPK